MSKKQISLLTFNVLAPCWAKDPAWMGELVVKLKADTRFSLAASMLGLVKADIVLLQEVTEPFRAVLEKTPTLAALYDMSALSSNPSTSATYEDGKTPCPNGTMILVKKALNAGHTFAAKVLTDAKSGEKVGAMTVAYGGCVFWSIHLDGGSDGAGQLADLAKQIGSNDVAVVGGDYNLVPSDLNANPTIKALSKSSAVDEKGSLYTCFNIKKGGLCLDHAISTSAAVTVSPPFPAQFEKVDVLRFLSDALTKHAETDPLLAVNVAACYCGSDHIPVPFLVVVS